MGGNYRGVLGRKGRCMLGKKKRKIMQNEDKQRRAGREKEGFAPEMGIEGQLEGKVGRWLEGAGWQL